MLKKSKKSILILIVTFTAAFWFSFSFNTTAQTKPTIEFHPLNKAGVKIPVRNYEIINGDTLEFDLYREDISFMDYVWSWLWGKNFGFYMSGLDTSDTDIKCPYIEEKQKQAGSAIQKIGDGKYHVKLVLSKYIVDAIIENQCAVSPRPRKAPDAGDNYQRYKHKGETSDVLFPTIHD